MAALLVCWIVFPALLGVLSLGCGLAVEQLAGGRLPTGLVLPCGFAALIGLGALPVISPSLASFSTPLVVVVALIGIGLTLPWRAPPVGREVLVGGAAGFLLGAPVILSGHATFAGFIKLDDTSTWLGIADRAFQHGRDLSTLAPSTYQEALAHYLGTGYPVGSFVPMAVGHTLLGTDTAWLFQPSISFMGAMLALALWTLLAPAIRSALLRGAVALLGCGSALLVGYAWWGSIKELCTSALVATVAALAAMWTGPRRVHALVPTAVVLAATVASLSAGGVIWAIPALIPALVVFLVAWARRGFAPRLPHPQLVVAAVVLVVLSLPALTSVGKFSPGGRALFTNQVDIGNLIGPISVLHASGVWLSGDFRTGSIDNGLNHLLIYIAIAVAVLGVVWAVGRRGWGVLLYVAASAVTGLAVFHTAGPWVAAKALAIASPAVPLAAGAAVAMAYERGWRFEAGAVAVAVVVGIGWSYALQYHAVLLAPRDQLRDLEHAAPLVAHKGPTLLTEYQPYGARHFLREGDPESVSELRRRFITLRQGGDAAKGTSVDVDDIVLQDLLVYRSLVVRRSPAASRPPAPYQLIWHGRFYEVWQRPDAPPPVLDHLSLGTRTDPGAVPRCSDVEHLAQLPGAVRLATVRRDSPTGISLGSLPLPPHWHIDAGGNQSVIYPGHNSGAVHSAVAIDHPARYTVWVGSSFRARVGVSIDGHQVGAARHQIAESGAYYALGTTTLNPGNHELALSSDGRSWHPGSSGYRVPLGPVVVADETADRPVTYVPIGQARSLCGQRLDWVEALSS